MAEVNPNEWHDIPTGGSELTDYIEIPAFVAPVLKFRDQACDVDLMISCKGVADNDFAYASNAADGTKANYTLADAADSRAIRLTSHSSVARYKLFANSATSGAQWGLFY